MFYVDVGSDLGVFSPAEWKSYAQSMMLRFEPLHAPFASGVQTLFLRVHELDPV